MKLVIPHRNRDSWVVQDSITRIWVKRCERVQTNVQISCGLGLIFRETNELVSTGVQGPVVQTLDSAVHWINNYRTAE